MILTLDAARDRRLFIHAEPGVVALLLYGAVRLLPQRLTSNLTFSTFEPYHRNIRDYKLARVVGTYLGSLEKGLEADLGSAGIVALDTFNFSRSSVELRKPMTDSLQTGLNGLIEFAVQGDWALVELHQTMGDDWDMRGWLEEGGTRTVQSIQPLTSESIEILELDDTLPSPAPSSASLSAPKLPPARPVGAMTYSAAISRYNPACLLFLIDQSHSMGDRFVGSPQSKATVVADALNRLIQNVVLRSVKGDGVRDYFRIGVIGYGRGIRAGFGGSLPFNILVPVNELGMHPLRVETRTKLVPDERGELIEQTVKFPVWFDPVANGQTPMCEAYSAAGLAVKGFVDEFPHAFPPIVLNLTDGMPSDGSPQVNARMIQNMGTTDGAADLQPAHLQQTGPGGLLSRRGRSPGGQLLQAAVSHVEYSAAEDVAGGRGGRSRAATPRGVVLNADPTAIVRFLDIGTRVSPSR